MEKQGDIKMARTLLRRNLGRRVSPQETGLAHSTRHIFRNQSSIHCKLSSRKSKIPIPILQFSIRIF